MNDSAIQYNWMTGDHTFSMLASINPIRWNGWKHPQAAVEALQEHLVCHLQTHCCVAAACVSPLLLCQYCCCYKSAAEMLTLLVL